MLPIRSFVLYFVILLNFVPFISADYSYLQWQKATSQQIEAARTIGLLARREFLQQIRGVSSARDRQSLYFEGLQKCNQIDDEFIPSIDQNLVKRKYRKNDAEMLEKIGFQKFFAAFVTLPVYEMTKVVNFACAKHEQQLECGLQFEGRAKTNERVQELMQDGSNRQMFEHECIDDNYATSVYPCLGKTEKWVASCQKEIDEYAEVRSKVNSKIENLYNSAVQSVKESIDNDEKQIIFTSTMKFINYAEGSKCLSFKRMRVCIMSQLVNNCDVETARAFNTTLSTGYLRNERSDRLQSDFESFSHPTHPFCDGL